MTETETRWEGDGVGGGTPGVVEGWVNRELGSPEGRDGGPKRSGVGAFGESVRDHVGREGEIRVITGPTQTTQGTLHVSLDGVGEGSVGVRKRIRNNWWWRVSDREGWNDHLVLRIIAGGYTS